MALYFVLAFVLVSYCYGGQLFGTAGIDGAGTLVSYDPLNGNTTTIMKPTIDLRSSAFGRGCYDEIHNILYQVYNQYNSSTDSFITALYPFNLNNASKQLQITYLSQLYANEYAGAALQCTSDPKTGDIYLWGPEGIQIPGTHQVLLQLTYNNGDILNISEIKKYPIGINFWSLISGPMSIYDSKRDMIWFPATCCEQEDQLAVYYYYINPINGDIINTVNFDNGSWPIETCSYHPSLDMLIGLKWTGEKVNNDNFVYLYRMIDPVNLNIINEYNVTGTNTDWCQWDFITTLDVVNNIFYNIIFKEPTSNMSCGGEMFGYWVNIDVNTGNIIHDSLFCEVNLNETCPIAIQYSST